jgi:hypothetical protein
MVQRCMRLNSRESSFSDARGTLQPPREAVADESRKKYGRMHARSMQRLARLPTPPDVRPLRRRYLHLLPLCHEHHLLTTSRTLEPAHALARVVHDCYQERKSRHAQKKCAVVRSSSRNGYHKIFSRATCCLAWRACSSSPSVSYKQQSLSMPGLIGPSTLDFNSRRGIVVTRRDACLAVAISCAKGRREDVPRSMRTLSRSK